jgi:chromosome segregation ATPase
MTQPEIQQEIEQTRERLGQTVEELAAKADLKARARAKAAEVKARAAEASGRVRQSQAVRRDWPLAMVAAGILVIGAALVWRQRTT